MYNFHPQILSTLRINIPGALASICGSVDWVPACEPKGHWLDSQSGHMPRLWARSPVGGAQEATTHWRFSPSLSPSLPLSLKIKKTLKKKDCFPWFQHLLKIIIVNISVQSTSSYTERTQLRQWRILATKGKPEGAGRRHSYTKGKLHYHKMVIKYYHCLKNLFPLLNH